MDLGLVYIVRNNREVKKKQKTQNIRNPNRY